MKSPWHWIWLLSALLLASIAVSLAVGPVTIPLDRVLRILFASDTSQLEPFRISIVWELRLPRILLASVVGVGLGVAGAGFQGLFRNPLADPFVVGASSGAALGAILAIVTGLQWSFFGLSPRHALALVGALLAVMTVFGVANIGRQAATLSLLLAGVAVSSFIAALVSLLMFMNHEQLVTIFGWLMGSFSRGEWSVLQSTAPLIAVGAVAVWLLSRSLDSLTFGEETAASLGIRIGRLRGLLVFAASLATAAGVAACGIIGFVGLIAPHLARLLVGARHALVIPASGLLGALLLLIADDLARTVAAPEELPVGIVTALLGSPFFLYLLITRQQELRATW